jgi:hypothetical protein
MAKLDKSDVRKHIEFLAIEEVATLIDDIISNLKRRQGVFTEAEAFLSLAEYSLNKET